MPLYNRAVILACGGVKEFLKARRNAWEGGAMHRLLVAHNILRQTNTVSIVGATFAKRIFDLETIKFVEQRLKILEDRNYIRCFEGKIYFLRKAENEIDVVKTISNIINEGLRIESFQAIKNSYRKLFKKVNNFNEVEKRMPSFFKRRYYALRHPFLLSEAYDIAAAEILGNRYRETARYTNAMNIIKYPSCAKRYEYIRYAINFAKNLSPSQIAFDTLEPEKSYIPSTLDDLDIMPFNNLKYKFAVVFSDTHVMPIKHPQTSELMRFFWMVNNILQATKIGNGDIFDIWAYGGKLEKILDENPMFLRGLVKSQKFIYIPGNHDGFMRNLLKKFDWILRPQIVGAIDGELYDENRRIFIKHGHQMDVFNKEKTKTGRIATRIAYLISGLLGERYGPKFLRWSELSMLLFLPRAIWQEERVKATVEMIKDDFVRLNKERISKGLNPFSSEAPLIYIAGHQHSMGITYTFDQIKNAILSDDILSEEIKDEHGNVLGRKSKVNFYFSGTWYDKKIYAGDFIVLDLTEEDNPLAFQFCWQYTLPEFFISYYKKGEKTDEEKKKTRFTRILRRQTKKVT